MNSGYGIRLVQFWKYHCYKCYNFGVDKSSSLNAETCKNNLLILTLGQFFGINGSFDSPETKLVLVLLKQMQDFAWAYIIMLIKVTCLLMEKK